MRTAADLRAAAARAGLEVVQTEIVPVAGGGQALAARMAFDDPWAAARLLVDLSEEDAGDPTVRAWSLSILKATAAAIGEPLGPTLSPALHDAFARAIHANVQAHIKFVHEPEETFQAAPITMQTGAGDCDDHARLVYALARAGGLEAHLGFFEEEEDSGLPLTFLRGGGDVVPVHVVAEIQDADGSWQWAETTIDADYGEEPHDALARLGGSLDAGSNPLAHVEGLGGGIGLDFVTPADVQNRKTQLNAAVDSLDADAVHCAALDSPTMSAWNEFVAAWREFYADAPSFWNAGGQGRQTQDYADQIRDWQTRMGRICTVTGAPLPETKDANILGAITTIAIAAGVVAVAWTVRPLLTRL